MAPGVPCATSGSKFPACRAALARACSCKQHLAFKSLGEERESGFCCVN